MTNDQAPGEARLTRAVLVTDPVKAVTPNAPLAIPLVGGRINLSAVGQIMEKPGIKDSDVRCIRKHCARLFIHFHRAGIVQRGQLSDFLQHRPNVFVDQYRLAEIRPAMHEPVPDCRHGFICEPA